MPRIYSTFSSEYVTQQQRLLEQKRDFMQEETDRLKGMLGNNSDSFWLVASVSRLTGYVQEIAKLESELNTLYRLADKAYIPEHIVQKVQPHVADAMKGAVGTDLSPKGAVRFVVEHVAKYAGEQLTEDQVRALITPKDATLDCGHERFMKDCVDCNARLNQILEGGTKQ